MAAPGKERGQVASRHVLCHQSVLSWTGLRSPHSSPRQGNGSPEKRLHLEGQTRGQLSEKGSQSQKARPARPEVQADEVPPECPVPSALQCENLFSQLAEPGLQHSREVSGFSCSGWYTCPEWVACQAAYRFDSSQSGTSLLPLGGGT